MKITTVVLRGGPFDGAEVPDPGGSLIYQGDPVPEGMVARYRKSRVAGVYTFREYDRIIGEYDRIIVGVPRSVSA